MARSLATRTSTLFSLLRRERVHLAAELVDAVVERGAVAVARPQEQRADDADDHDDAEEGETAAHRSLTSRRSVAASPQSSPSRQRSFFQIGTVALSVSMHQRAASNASPRWGALTATTTATSVSDSAPVRCSSAIRPRPSHRRRASTAISYIRGSACSTYASYSSRVTPDRPS